MDVGSVQSPPTETDSQQEANPRFSVWSKTFPTFVDWPQAWVKAKLGMPTNRRLSSSRDESVAPGENHYTLWSQWVCSNMGVVC